MKQCSERALLSLMMMMCEWGGVFTTVPCAAILTAFTLQSTRTREWLTRLKLSDEFGVIRITILETVWRFDSPPEDLTMSGSFCRSLYALTGISISRDWSLRLESDQNNASSGRRLVGGREGRSQGMVFPSTYVQVEVRSLSQVCVCVCGCVLRALRVLSSGSNWPIASKHGDCIIGYLTGWHFGL